MPDLEKTLRDLATAGELTHLSICAVAGKGPGGIVFSVSYTPASISGTGFGRSDDPVAAVMEALADDRLKGLHKKLAKASPATGPKVPEPPPAAEPQREPEPWEL